MNTKKIIVVMFIMAILAAPHLRAEAKAIVDEVYIFNYQPKDLAWTLKLPAPKASSVFILASAGVDILTVICDGKSILPRRQMLINNPGLGFIAGIDCRVVYQFNHNAFGCWDETTMTRTLHPYRRFELPEKVSSVVIRYRIRFPNGSSSGPLEARFYASDNRDDILLIPK